MSVNYSKQSIDYLPDKIREGLTECEANIYLIGGAIRDVLLGRESHDYDFVVEGNVRYCAKRIAKILNGFLYVLDDTRNTFRVIYSTGADVRKTLDFAELQGGSIEEDLKKRDFTIDAIAVDISDTQKVYDPLNGIDDVKNKVVRACHKNAFIDDPIRIMRGIRIAQTLHFRIDKYTWQLMESSIACIKNVSSERIRDELFNMLDSEFAFAMLRLLDYLGLSTVLYAYPFVDCTINNPPFVDIDLVLNTINKYLDLYNVLIGGCHKGEANNLLFGMAVLELGRFKSFIRSHYDNALCQERSLRSLVVFSIIYLYTDLDCKPRDYLRYFRLSNKEIEMFSKILSSQKVLLDWSNSSEMPEDIDIFRYYQDSGAAGIDACLVFLASYLSKHNLRVSQEKWERLLILCKKLMEAWWEKRNTIVYPDKLVSGNDLKNVLNLESDKMIGKLLAEIKEAQVMGIVKTKTDALEHIKDMIDKT